MGRSRADAAAETEVASVFASEFASEFASDDAAAVVSSVFLRSSLVFFFAGFFAKPDDTSKRINANSPTPLIISRIFALYLHKKTCTAPGKKQ